MALALAFTKRSRTLNCWYLRKIRIDTDRLRL